MKISALEKVGFVSSCMASPQSYESRLNQWSKPTSARIATYALEQLEEARKKDVEAHERNLPQLEVHKAIHERVKALMDEVGMPTGYSVRDTKSRSRFPKTVSMTAGYLGDLLREAPVSDGFEHATHTYESLKKRYQEYAQQAEREATEAKRKADLAAEAEKAERRANIELATIILRYQLDIDATWDDILEALRGRNKYLDLAIAGEDTRGDWSDGPYRVEGALDRFGMDSDQDKEIVSDMLSCLRDFEDGRVFRDTRWSYEALYALVEDQQLVSDARLARSKSKEY